MKTIKRGLGVKDKKILKIHTSKVAFFILFSSNVHNFSILKICKIQGDIQFAKVFNWSSQKSYFNRKDSYLYNMLF